MLKFLLVVLEWKHVSLFLYWEVKGNLILHLEPEPLPTVTDQVQDEELDLSMEQENLGETENLPATICSSETNGKKLLSWILQYFIEKMVIICQQLGKLGLR